MDSQSRIETLGQTIKTRVVKGDKAIKDAEDHYIAAGLHLLEAKALVAECQEISWTQFLSEHCAISKSRAYELIRLANGKTTLTEIRANNAASHLRSRDTAKSRAGRPGNEPTQSKPDPKDVMIGDIAARLRSYTLEEIERVGRFISAMHSEHLGEHSNARPVFTQHHSLN